MVILDGYRNIPGMILRIPQIDRLTTDFISLKLNRYLRIFNRNIL